MWYDCGMKQASLRRGAVGANPAVLALGALFVGLMAWAAFTQWNAIDPRGIDGDRLRNGAIWGAVLIGLLVVVGAAAAGLITYFAMGKSERAANVGTTGVLVLGIVLAARQVYRVYDRIEQRDRQAAAGIVGDGTSAGIVRSGSGGTPYVVPRPATPAPMTMAPSATQGGRSSPFGTGGSPAAPVAPTAKTPPLPVPAFDGKPVLDKLRVEYAAKCEALAVKAEAAYAAAAQPKKVNQLLDEWIEKFNTLKAEAEALEAEIRELSMRGAREALEKAGAPLGDAASQAIGFGEEFGTFQRQVACGEVSRFAERGAELFTIIKENIAKVQIDSKGEATSKDRAVETKLFHARSQLGFAVKRKDETLKKVRGKE